MTRVDLAQDISLACLLVSQIWLCVLVGRLMARGRKR